MTASPGVAAGPVHRVTKDVDALAFPDGGVLVTDRALARWAALLPRASAVVSEKGSLTGHLANVAREFVSRPCSVPPGPLAASTART
jgi:pyruvate,water dikinase